MGNSPHTDITKMKAEMTREFAKAARRQQPDHVSAAEPSQKLNVLSDARYARGNMTKGMFSCYTRKAYDAELNVSWNVLSFTHRSGRRQSNRNSKTIICYSTHLLTVNREF
jgi:hypothetical protein